MYKYNFTDVEDITEKSKLYTVWDSEGLERAKDYAYDHVLTCFKYENRFYKKIMGHDKHPYVECDARGNPLND